MLKKKITGDGRKYFPKDEIEDTEVDTLLKEKFKKVSVLKETRIEMTERKEKERKAKPPVVIQPHQPIPSAIEKTIKNLKDINKNLQEEAQKAIENIEALKKKKQQPIHQISLEMINPRYRKEIETTLLGSSVSSDLSEGSWFSRNISAFFCQLPFLRCVESPSNSPSNKKK